jgi:hypothetical protein
MKSARVTICMPCFGRPERTKRAVECILAQTVTEYEAYIIGDCCPDFQNLLDSGWMDEKIKEARSKGSMMVASNMPMHMGGYGYEIRNKVKELAESNYFLYLDNDDIIEPTHLSHYLSQIEDTEFDLVYFDTMVDAANYKRISELREGMVGHSELMIRTDFLKRMPPHQKEYGHDWKIIESMINAGAKVKKSTSGKTTYHVMSLPNLKEQRID